MIVNKVPAKSPVLINSVSISAIYDSFTPRQGFRFDVPANQNIELMKTQTNTIYLWDSVQFATNVSENDFLGAIDILPAISLTRGINGSTINSGFVNLTKYSERKEISTFFESNNSSDTIRINASGRLKMTEKLLDYNEIKIVITFNIFQINERGYLENYNSDIKRSFSDTLRM